MTISLSEISVSPCETHHLRDKKPFYTRRFLKVLKYHNPGLAPVIDEKGAYHINLQGLPAYPFVFKRTFGFYENRAAVESEEGWFHISQDGYPVYAERYAWCGNFQEGCCPVRDYLGNYFHINLEGISLYLDKYTYVGDFKDGMAVVCNEKGQHTHIDQEGKFIHSCWFYQLDVFHKGFARAKDKQGWGHINKQGQFIYQNRYETVEPFYNGIAHVEDFKGRVFLIDETGEIVQMIHDCSGVDTLRNSLSNDMVGFWKTWALYTAIDLKIPDYLPSCLEEIAAKTSVPITQLKRLVKALWELDVLKPAHHNHWELTDKGKFLQSSSLSSLAAAGLMWGKVNKAWESLPILIKQDQQVYRPSFKELEENNYWLQVYHKALDGYAQQDFSTVSSLPFWRKHKNLLGFGRCSLTLINFLLERYDHLTARIVGSKKELSHFDISSDLKSRFEKDYKGIENFSESQNDFPVDAVILPRFLHYFPDTQVLNFLQDMKKQLLTGGYLYILEMILNENNPIGGLFDLNMLIETGGKVRSFEEWHALFLEAGCRIIYRHDISPALSLLQVT